jgi:hypothetical protein
VKVAIYSEGPADSEVITNILKGALGIDRSDIKYDLPELDFDETDLQNQKIGKFSSWSSVKQECETRKKINDFLNTFDTNRFIVIHLDTAERSDYGATKTVKGKDSVSYSEDLRKEIITTIHTWLKHNYTERIAYAIAIEETDAWVLTLANNISGDTAKIAKPKEKLSRSYDSIVSRSIAKKIGNLKESEQKQVLSEGFRKPKQLNLSRKKNKSLDLFLLDLEKLR